MERTNILPRWQKIGGGTFRLASGRIIKPNQKFSAPMDEIPMAFRDTVKRVGGDEYEEQEKAEERKLKEEENTPELVYSLEEEKPGWFNILDPQGKPINEKLLRQEAAEQLLEDLKE